jgi:hypothetical protein
MRKFNTEDDEIALALLKAHVDASDEELRDWNVSRNDVLWLAREFIGADEKLARVAYQTIRIFVAGRHSPDKR